MSTALPFIALTSGEPAGIGPDICVALAAQEHACRLAVLGDPDVLAERAARLGVDVALETLPDAGAARSHEPGSIQVVPVATRAPVAAGRVDPANADYVLEMLRAGARLCMRGEADALVTAPVHKSVIVEAGHRFSGHTELLAELTGAAQPVMLLAGRRARVALATTHLPLREVPGRITAAGLERVARVLDADLRRLFGVAAPRIRVLGLNPHAGEGGAMGREEIDTIAPALDALRAEGIDVRGPLSADTLFHAEARAGYDAALCMYHDQALIPLKTLDFARGVNVTLGLPFVRTSPDHGTAYDIAGTGRADPASLVEALNLAGEMAARRAAAPEG